MFNPLEMFQAQGEAGIQAMAQQFGLTPEQTARAFEALMPALTLGLQRGAGLDPNAFARMFGMPEVARAAAPQGLEALTQMFGSAWGEMAKAFMPGATAAPAPPPKPAPKAASKTAGEKAGEAGSAMIEQMMRTGAEVQGHNIRAMQELFETLWPSSGKPADPAPPKPEPNPHKPRRGRGPEGGTG
ncbi:DUF937 domain-containing protein [Methylobacterium brachiatum]|uniref:DUF937 domain-containing protein n=1 Tax=Methylobacterium brachiatum TaxID=269660 RepID=UPI0033155FF7